MKPTRMVQLPRERVKDRVWTIFVCAEPDGQDCASGTHPNVLTHRCAAMGKWHAWHADHPNDYDSDDAPAGPAMAMVEVRATNPEGESVSTTDAQRDAADRIAADYPETVRVTPGQGPRKDRMVIACPDGRTVVLGPDGSVIADSWEGDSTEA